MGVDRPLPSAESCGQSIRRHPQTTWMPPDFWDRRRSNTFFADLKKYLLKHCNLGWMLV
ncbi:hypothetical protein HMPREF1545_01038 [Oscillibacter sp. KLE 1728]|nr:hypothetical protein HMPREF1545_01038 [Oscillibacter sp. KLE 1728]ERK67311.1 hypothetical protein HMPREF1546_00547 [Oscillibacter sp. KLE 1745]